MPIDCQQSVDSFIFTTRRIACSAWRFIIYSKSVCLPVRHALVLCLNDGT